MHLFVYNNLRKGCDKHHLLRMSEYKGTYVTEGLYYMVATKEAPLITTVALHTGPPITIVGEVYDITTNILTLLDTQDTDHSRHVIRVRNSHTSFSAFIYVLTNRERINAIRHDEVKYPCVLHGDWTRQQRLESSNVR